MLHLRGVVMCDVYVPVCVCACVWVHAAYLGDSSFIHVLRLSGSKPAAWKNFNDDNEINKQLVGETQVTSQWSINGLD